MLPYLLCSEKVLIKPVRFIVNSFQKECIPVSWEKPKVGWTKLNFDGSCRGRNSRASIGGVFRNHRADILLAYAESIGRKSSIIAELAALRRGLELAKENGWNNVWLEGDAKELVDILEEKKEVKCRIMRNHIGDIKLIIPTFDNYIITHVYREGNRVADKLAHLGQDLDEPQIWANDLPHDVMQIVHEDACGKPVLRKKKK